MHLLARAAVRLDAGNVMRSRAWMIGCVCWHVTDAQEFLIRELFSRYILWSCCWMFDAILASRLASFQ